MSWFVFTGAPANPTVEFLGALPLTTGCSGFVTICFYEAGAPDPNGLDYSGLGYTGTLRSV